MRPREHSVPLGTSSVVPLPRRTARTSTRVIAVASGKGGVGKTSVAVNLAVTLARHGRSTLLLDADLGLANVDVLLGLQPKATLAGVLDGDVTLQEVVFLGPHGLMIVPAASGVSALAELSLQQQGGLIGAFDELMPVPEVVVIDTAPGIGSTVATFCQAADEVLVVACDEPASVTDAYGLMKVLSRERGVRRFRLLCNRVRDDAQGRRLHRTLQTVCDRFLDLIVDYVGFVPEDRAVLRAARAQRALVDVFPSSPAAFALKKLSRLADNLEERSPSSGGLRMFGESSRVRSGIVTAG